MVERKCLVFPITDKDLNRQARQRLRDTVERHFGMEIGYLKIIAQFNIRREDITLR